MPPNSDGTSVRTVGCSLSRLIPDEAHLRALQDAVHRVHKSTLLATELLNLHLRRTLEENPSADLKCFFTQNWVMKAYNEVTAGTGTTKDDVELSETKKKWMPGFEAPDRTGIQACLLADAKNLVTVASNNVWMHFKKRVLAHVKNAFELTEARYKQLTKEEKRQRKLDLMLVAHDITCNPSLKLEAPSQYQTWIASERTRIGIDNAVKWGKESLSYHMKASPHAFIRIMMILSAERESTARKSFSLYPLRRALVPRHVRFDQKALRDLLKLGKSDYIKEKEKRRRQEVALAKKKQKLNDGMIELKEDEPVKNRRRTKVEMEQENEELFGRIVDLRAANISRHERFDYTFTTDGVCARVQMTHIPASKRENIRHLPKRGIWAIDDLKRVSRLEEIHVVGIDPGKRELIVGVDMENTKSTACRYTMAQRRYETCRKKYEADLKSSKPNFVLEAEQSLCGYNSRSTSLKQFSSYCAKRHETLESCLTFYGDIIHRKRRWKTAIKAQKSEAQLCNRLKSMKTDKRPLVISYGTWGMVAGTAGAVCNKGLPPCIGKGLMKKLALHFVVTPTPEHCTSKTCNRCLGSCGPWTEVEDKMARLPSRKIDGLLCAGPWTKKQMENARSIRGLRRCTQRDCMIPLNRDRNAAINIGINFIRLFNDKSPIRSMTDEELKLHQASLCFECEY
jgi:hypothetical protein